jgi:hypothetical protein
MAAGLVLGRAACCWAVLGLLLGGGGRGLGFGGFALGALGLGGAGFQLISVALARGVGDVRLGGLGARHFLGGGDLLLGHIGQAVDVSRLSLLGGGLVGAVERVAGLLEFERRVARHLRIVVGGDEIGARLVQRRRGGRHGAAGGQQHGAGKIRPVSGT